LIHFGSLAHHRELHRSGDEPHGGGLSKGLVRSFDPLARSLLAAFSLRLALPLDKFIAFRDVSLAAII
jgi:hypothetical protein